MNEAQRAAWNHAASFRHYRAELGSTYITCMWDLVELRAATDAVLNRAIVQAYEVGKFSFTEIGEALGVSRQAARQRYLSVTE